MVLIHSPGAENGSRSRVLALVRRMRIILAAMVGVSDAAMVGVSDAATVGVSDAATVGVTQVRAR